MIRTNSSIAFRVPGLSDFAKSELPRGEVMRLSVNPYSGDVLLSYQDYGKALVAIDAVLDYLEECRDALMRQGKPSGFADFAAWVDDGADVRELGRFAPCPECGTVPVYDEATHLLECGCSPESLYCFRDEEQAREVWNFTHDYRKAA